MHELSISQAVVDTVVRHADGRRVTEVQLRVGGLRQVVPESLSFYFEITARGTVCAGARLEQELVPVRLRCTPCGREWGVDMPLFHCPTCGGSEVDVASGNELEVESIDVEATLERQEAPCTA
jgi:hydrogenase nickel incorporation protein HypA/HybF